MESQLASLEKFVLWGFGASVSMYLALCGWMWWIVMQLAQKVSYKWIEEKFEDDVKKEINKLNEVLRDIRDALVGDLKSEGILTRANRMEKDIEQLKNKVHEQNTNKH